jgi:pimeloyl-ACP methyl ester carboxylesterase
VSYSGAVALQMAADSPSLVHSLILLEPPPVHVPSAAQFFAANARLVEDYHAYGPVAGLDRFLTRVIGLDWRAVIERALPGAAEQMEQDAGTSFDTDIPALLAWTFGAGDARRITQAVLHIGGSESGSSSLRSASSCSRGCHRPRTWCWPGPTTPWPSPTRPRLRQP